MDPIIGSAVLGFALRQGIIRSKEKEAYRLSVSAAEKVAKAEVKITQHEQEATLELEKLFKRIQGK